MLTKRFVRFDVKITLILLTAILCVGCAATHNESISVVQTNRGVEISSMNSVLFDTGQYDLKPSASELLKNIANIINTKSKANVVVEGHTDIVGSASYNQDLSEMRALMVKKALVEYGVPKGRISAVGYGATRPKFNNLTDMGRTYNRRTDIILLGEKKENIDNIFLKLINKFLGG